MINSSPPHSLADRVGTPDRLRDFDVDRRLLLLSAMAVVVGLAGVASAWALLHLINLATNIAYYGRLSAGPADPTLTTFGPATVLIPIAGCLIIGFMARFGSERIRGHGIPEAMEAILIGRSRIEPKVALLKPLSSAISIGTGGPFGAEGPIIMTGGAFGSLFAQLFHLSNAERKTLLVAGAAAGMAGVFGTPIAAILLAVELLLFEWRARSLVPVATAAITAAGLRPWLIGGSVLFPMAASPTLPYMGLLLAAGLGVLVGLAAAVATLMVYGTEDLFDRLPLHWMWWPAIGGLAVGIGGLIEPHALGVGYGDIAALLHAQLATGPALRLLIVKALIWSIALGSGTSGGVLAPLLIIGGAIGSLFGAVAPLGDAALWALAGMAAMMGGTMRSPLTAIVFAVEVTHDMQAALPVTVACVFAYATTVLLMRRSILTEKVARRGHHVYCEYVVDPFERMRAAQIMARPAQSLSADWKAEQVLRFFTAADAPRRHKSYPVVDRHGQVLGMVGRADALRWTVEGVPADQTLREVVAGQTLVFGYEDELVGRIADRMAVADIGRVPILRRTDGGLVGLVARRDLLRVRASVAREEREREVLLRLGRTG